VLNAYLTQLSALIQAPNSPNPLVSTATQTGYINIARNQLAGDAECVRVRGSLTYISGQRTYLFSNIVLPASQGYGSVIAVRSAAYSGLPDTISFRPFEWFSAYLLNSGATGTPTVFSQQGQGVFGTLLVWPFPAAPAVASLDCVCLPIPLVDDTTVEAIPDLWRDAVPFYAAWLAMQQLQRQADAEAMLQRYMMLARRGRQFATPSELPDNMPGGLGSQIAAGKTILGQPQQQRGR
jgi:hypothetical protein